MLPLLHLKSSDKLLYRFGAVVTVLVGPVLDVVHRGTLRTRGVVTHKGKVVLIKNRIGKQKWALPGGGVHKREKPADGVLREIREEIGALTDGVEPELIHFGTRYSKRTHFHYLAYHVELPTNKINRNRKELTAAAWFPLDSLPEESNMTSLTRKMLSVYRQRQG